MGKADFAQFNILLADVILKYNLTEKDIQKLGEMTATRQIAHATVGHAVYYRKETIERLFNRG